MSGIFESTDHIAKRLILLSVPTNSRVSQGEGLESTTENWAELPEMLRLRGAPLEAKRSSGNTYGTAGLSRHRAICFSTCRLPVGILDRNKLGSAGRLSGILL